MSPFPLPQQARQNFGRLIIFFICLLGSQTQYAQSPDNLPSAIFFPFTEGNSILAYNRILYKELSARFEVMLDEQQTLYQANRSHPFNVVWNRAIQNTKAKKSFRLFSGVDPEARGEIRRVCKSAEYLIVPGQVILRTIEKYGGQRVYRLDAPFSVYDMERGQLIFHYEKKLKSHGSSEEEDDLLGSYRTQVSRFIQAFLENLD